MKSPNDPYDLDRFRKFADRAKGRDSQGGPKPGSRGYGGNNGYNQNGNNGYNQNNQGPYGNPDPYNQGSPGNPDPNSGYNDGSGGYDQSNNNQNNGSGQGRGQQNNRDRERRRREAARRRRRRRKPGANGRSADAALRKKKPDIPFKHQHGPNDDKFANFGDFDISSGGRPQPQDNDLNLNPNQQNNANPTRNPNNRDDRNDDDDKDKDKDKDKDQNNNDSSDKDSDKSGSDKDSDDKSGSDDDSGDKLGKSNSDDDSDSKNKLGSSDSDSGDKSDKDKSGLDGDSDSDDKSDKDKSGSDDNSDDDSDKSGKDKDKDSDDKSSKDKSEKSKDSDKSGSGKKKKGKGHKLKGFGKLLGSLSPLGAAKKFKDFLDDADNKLNDQGFSKNPHIPLRNVLQKLLNFLRRFLRMIILYMEALRLWILYKLAMLLKAMLTHIFGWLQTVWNGIVAVASIVAHAAIYVFGGWLAALGAATIGAVVILITALLIIFAGIQQQSDQIQQALYQELCDDNGHAKSNDDDTGKQIKGSSGDWTKKGSHAYKVAKSIFDAWVDHGASGAAAAGIVGWVNSEGGFQIIDRAEGHYGNSESENGVSAGVVPIPSGTGYSKGGAGIYQFTPYDKFAPLRSKRWLSASAQTKFVMKAVGNGEWNMSMDLSGKHHTPMQFATETDPVSACLAWQSYERGDVRYINTSRKSGDAKTAYKLFHGSKYKPNRAKLRQLFGHPVGGAVSAIGDAISDVVHNAVDDFCENTEEKNDGGSGWIWPFASIKGKNANPKFLNGGQYGHTIIPRGHTNFHDGVDWSNGANGVHFPAPVHAVHAGVIHKVGKVYGWYYIWEKTGDYNIIYQEAFNGTGSFKVKAGDHVKRNQIIAIADNTGPTAGHLHLGITTNKLNPTMNQTQNSAANGYDHPECWLNPVKVIKNGYGSGGSRSDEGGTSIHNKYAQKVMRKESSGNYKATNGKYYGAWQLDKSYITSKKYGGDGSLSHKNQDYVAERYMKSRYGSWKKAWDHELSANWW